ncbi:hypothetical protein AAC387_Pa02g1577 [Persea americana]
MSEEDTDFGWLCSRIVLIFLLILITGQVVAGSSLQTDKEVLLQLKSFLEVSNKIQQNRGRYVEWGNSSKPSPCDWPGIECSSRKSRVTGIDLSDANISGSIFDNYSALTELSMLDLSKNVIGGLIPLDLNRCQNLTYLNLSHNILDGELNLSGLNKLEVLDVTVNRLYGGIQSNFPSMCSQLVTLNLSSNNFSGELYNSFDECLHLQNLDLSSNNFSGPIWLGLARLREFSVSENNFTGEIPPSIFSGNCVLQILDLSGNKFYGEIPKEVSNCKVLVSLNLSGNRFAGKIPSQIGSLSSLESLYLGSNNLSSEIPDSLLNCSTLAFLDLSKNNFGGTIQNIFKQFVQLKFLLLHGNNYTDGIVSSGILRLPNIERLDLSFNMFNEKLPIEISEMSSLKFLILAQNQFFGSIPSEFGKLSGLQALDLSFNSLTGKIPPSIGNMTSLLWLMLANNTLTGEIPPEIGNCSSMLWLNLAYNELSGTIPAELSRIGANPGPTFESNRQATGIIAGSGECLTMKRWIPATHPPFSFVYNLLTRKSCRSIWDQILKGYGLFPTCRGSSSVRKLEISGYLQLTGNNLSGAIPHEIGEMQNFSLFHLGTNRFSGPLTPAIAKLPLVLLNLSFNGFSGLIPAELGDIRCLQSLDLSSNNFSGEFPLSLNRLTELNRFNISYNPLISGEIPATGQLATFENDSFIGDPNIILGNSKRTNFPKIWPSRSGNSKTKKSSPTRKTAFLVFLALTFTFIICGVLSLIVCLFARGPLTDSVHLLEQDSKHYMSSPSTSGAAKVFNLDDSTLSFNYDDIVMATGDFSDDMVIGKGGFGVVYRGVLQDGRKVAVKKLQREGSEGEREFRAEMQVLSGGSGGAWPNPNLVTLFGWCLYGSDKLLVYEYMEGGSLEEVVTDWERLGWAGRVEVAVGVARALAFLHHDCFPAVVHRDVKASNVLLDKEGRPRVTDFGLARVVRPGDTHVSTVVAGTVGYVAPEYGHMWHATTKGDVYSFGVLLMELATGKRAVDGGDGEEECLVEWVRRVGGGRKGLRGIVLAVLLERGGRDEGVKEMCELLKLGLRCTAETPQARPDMKEVLAMLVRI